MSDGVHFGSLGYNSISVEMSYIITNGFARLAMFVFVTCSVDSDIVLLLLLHCLS